MNKQQRHALKLVNALQSGQTTKAISKQFGITPTALSYVRRALGMPAIKAGPTGPHTKTPELVAQAKAMKIAGNTYREIGERLGVTGQCVQQWITSRKEHRPIPGTPCGECGVVAKLHRHHTDYNGGPIVHLCVSCHGKHHGRRKGVKNKCKHSV